MLLIGDSIRLHYQPYVRERLTGEAEVNGPRENCRCSRETRERLKAWLDAFPADIVHLNCGLHDIRIDPGSADVLVPLPEYTKNVEAILRVAQERVPEVIWASSTPINETLHRYNKVSRRSEGDLQAYNRAAMHVALSLGVHVHDLWQTVSAYGAASIWHSDGVHFTEQGYVLIGRWVADAINSITSMDT